MRASLHAVFNSVDNSLYPDGIHLYLLAEPGGSVRLDLSPELSRSIPKVNGFREILFV